jgi:hypothetical protein
LPSSPLPPGQWPNAPAALRHEAYAIWIGEANATFVLPRWSISIVLPNGSCVSTTCTPFGSVVLRICPSRGSCVVVVVWFSAFFVVRTK